MCRRGQENLYHMTKDWFEVCTNHGGKKYLLQVQDDLGKNHHEDDHTLMHQGKMYAVEGINPLIIPTEISNK